MIDAAWVLGGGEVLGNTGSGDYTTVAYERGAGLGATITPAGGDTGKTLFVPNAGDRNTIGAHGFHGTGGYLWPATQYDGSSAWYIDFSGVYPSGRLPSYPKLTAFPLRCVRS